MEQRGDDRLLTAAQAAQYTTLTLRRVYDLVQTGDLPHLRLGARKGLRFSVAQLDQWLADKAVAAQQAS